MTMKCSDELFEDSAKYFFEPEEARSLKDGKLLKIIRQAARRCLHTDIFTVLPTAKFQTCFAFPARRCISLKCGQ